LISSDWKERRREPPVREPDARSHATDFVHQEVPIGDLTNLSIVQRAVENVMAALQNGRPLSSAEQKTVRVVHSGIAGDSAERHAHAGGTPASCGLTHVIACRSRNRKRADICERLDLLAQGGLVNLQKIDRGRYKKIAHRRSSLVESNVPFFGMPAQAESTAQGPRSPDVADDIVIDEEHIFAATQQDDYISISRCAGLDHKINEVRVDDLAQCSTNRLRLGTPDKRDIATGGATD
jgi:hypothetical protein